MTQNPEDNCDRCGREVKSKEDTMHLHAVIKDDPMLTFYQTKKRHIRCSPSTAQYIVHANFEPIKDDRVQYTKYQHPEERRKKIERQYTEAWLELQKHVEEDEE